MAGRACELVPYDDDADVWQHPDTATTVRLPARAPAAPAPAAPAPGPRRPAAWYRVALAHRAMHQACGTFGFDLDRDEPLFTRHRPSASRPGVPHLEQFLRCFSRTALAVEVLAVLEDLRIDTIALRRLPGLAPAYTAAMRAALGGRPDPGTLPPRGAVAEALVRLTLGAREVALAESAVPALGVVTGVARGSSTRARARKARRRRRSGSIRCSPAFPTSRRRAPSRCGSTTFPSRRRGSRDHGDRPGGAARGRRVFDVRFVPVRFRDVPGPRYLGQAASGMPLQEAILRMTPRGGPDEPPEDAEDAYTAKSAQAERGEAGTAPAAGAAARAAPP